MKSILRATAILSISSVFSIFTGLFASKTLAVLLGPTGFGFVGLLQNLIMLCEMIASMGIGVALVRSGASAWTNRNHSRLATLKKAAFILFFIFGASASMLLIFFRNEVGYWMLGGVEQGRSVIFLTVAVLFKIASSMQIGLLNACHRVGVMARSNVLDSLLVSLIFISVVYLFGFDGIVPMMILGAAASWLVSHVYLNRVMTPSSISPPLNDVKEAARSLLAVGGPYTASLLVGTGIQLLLPFLVLHTLNAESVGHYRAAVSVSAAYSSFLIASISKDYYPRISAASGNPKAMVDIVNQQQYFVLVLGSPVILTGIAVAPYLIPLLFSTEFSPAADVLEWQLIGDLFRLSSWTMSFAILVRCSGVTYFLTELSAGMTTLLTSWIAVRLFGLPGLGISFLITYIVYYVVVWAIVRRDIKLTCTALNKKMLFFAVASALSIHLISWTALSDYKQYIALLLALVLAAVCICSLRNEIWRMRDAKVNNRLSDI